MLHPLNLVLNEYNGIPIYKDFIYIIYYLDINSELPRVSSACTIVRCLVNFIWLDVNLANSDVFFKKQSPNLSIENTYEKWFEDICKREIPQPTSDLNLNSRGVEVNNELIEVYKKWFEDMAKYESIGQFNRTQSYFFENICGKKSWVRPDQHDINPFEY